MNRHVRQTWSTRASEPMPTTSHALASYIANDKEFRGIGTALAARLAERFGRHLRDALRNRDAEVVAVLGYDVAETAFAAFQLRAEEAGMIDWLEEKGIASVVGVPKAIRIARCWGSEGVAALKENPYLLLAFLPWKDVDLIARALGFAPADPRRAAAAVEAILYERLDKNDTWVAQHDVKAGVAKLLNSVAAPVGGQELRAIDVAVESGGACRLGNGLQPFGAAVMEEAIAQHVATALSSPVYHDLLTPLPVAGDLAAQIDNFQKCQPHALTDKQSEAIRIALTNRIMVLAGYAGSGKTTSLRGICEIAEAQGRELHLMALSGRAAQRMQLATGRPARTIAGFLHAVAGVNGSQLPSAAMVIVDEASMLDLPTLWRIMKVLGDANLVLVGDPAQLPPIGFGLTFHVLCDTPAVPRVVLDRVMRQSTDTGIPRVADAVRNGQVPSLSAFTGATHGVSFVECGEGEVVDVISDIGGMLKASGVELGETQIISPVKSGPSGIGAINRHFHSARQSARNAEPFPGRDDIAGGDPIIWTKNDWDRELMNGSMGRLHSVADGIAHATLDGKAFDLTAADAERVALAYAISVHKAQGSQWRRVIVPVFSSKLLDRTLLYTAITRATEQVILVGDMIALEQAVTRAPKSLERSIGLGQRLNRNIEHAVGARS